MILYTDSVHQKELKMLLESQFDGLTLRSPLFYSHKIGLRFELGTSTDSFDEYFRTGFHRAKEIFTKVFGRVGTVLVYVQERKVKPRQRLKRHSFFFRMLKPIVLQYRKRKNIYETGEVHNTFTGLIDLSISNVDAILREIQGSEHRHSLCLRHRRSSRFGCEVFFIDPEARIIYYVYDDRGVDVVATRVEDLRKLYVDFNDWILDHDRKRIEEQSK